MTIEMRNITKRFGSVTVLEDVNFSLLPSEIHALVGENGAGKTTLMNILSATYQKDGGEILIDKKPVQFKNYQEAEKNGIIFIRQELSLFNEMTVEENLFIGKEIKRGRFFTDSASMKKRAQQVLAQLGAFFDVTERIENLSIGQQQTVEIARALLQDAKVLIMDEPTAALTIREAENLFKIARMLSERGVSIVYISHRMEEIFKLCHRITVLRDGQSVGERKVSEASPAEIIKLMIGREITAHFSHTPALKNEVVLQVKDLSKKGQFSNIDFSVRAGEVFGVAGLMGAGRTEIMQTLFGVTRPDSGSIIIDGKEVKITSPARAKQLGIAYITEDRKSEGLLLDETIQSNVSLNNFDKIVYANLPFKFIQSSREKTLAEKAIERFSIKSDGIHTRCINLSGGNQQKVVFAKSLQDIPRILILDEPTRGIDVGAKKEIYTIINELAKQGTAIIMISSDLPEVLGMSDTVMVVCAGRNAGILDRADANEQVVMTLATGG